MDRTPATTDLPAYQPGEAPPLKPTDIRLVGPKAAFDKLGRPKLDELNARLRGSRQQRRHALSQLRKLGLRVELGESSRTARPTHPIPVSDQ